MSKYKKPKVGFLDHVAGKSDKSDPIDKVLKEAAETAPPPEPKKTKGQTKKPVIKEEVKPSAPGMESYVKATQVDPASVKGSFDDKAVEGYTTPIAEEKKLETDPAKMSAYQKVLQESKKRKKDSVQHLGEAADLLGGEPEKPVTQADLRALKVSMASLGGGGIDIDEAIRIAKEYAVPLDSGQDSNLQFFLEHFDSVRDALNAATDYDKFDFDSDWDERTTNDLPEPSFVGFSDSYNKWFTQERARASIQSIDSALIYDPVTGNLAFNQNFEGRYTTVNFDSDFSAKSTDSLSEGSTNLYYTDSRAREAIQSIDSSLIYDNTTGNLSLAIDPNEFYTTVDFDSDFSTKSTDSLTEGATNLYYTDSRARSAISSGDSYIQYDSTTGVITFDESRIPEGYTSEDFDSDFLTKNTDSLAEGSSNLYYTTARFDSDAATIVSRLDSLDGRVDSDDIEIQNLKNKVDELDVNSAIAVEWDKILSFDSNTDSVPRGEYGVHFDGAGTNYINVDKFYFNCFDKHEVFVPFAGVLDSADIIVVSDSDGGIARYEVTGLADFGNHFRVDVTALLGMGGPADTLSAKIYPATDNSSLATYDYVDAQDRILQQQINDLDSANDSEHAWNLAEHAKLDSDKVAKKGDTMTGSLLITNPNQLSTNNVNSVGNSNMSIKRNGTTKIQITSNANRQFQKSVYNSNYGVTDDLDIPHKLYVDNSIDSAIDELSQEVSETYLPLIGGTLTGNLNISNAGNLLVDSGNIRTQHGHVQTNTLKSVGNSNIVVERNNERRMLWGTNNIIADKKIRYNTGYNRDSYTSDMEGQDSYTLMPKWYIDSAVENASFLFDSSRFVGVTGDTMTGQLAISRSSEHNVALRVKRDDQSRLYIRSDGMINWTADATNAVLNRDDGDLSFNIDGSLFMKFDQSQGEIEIAKTLTLTAPDKVINLPTNSDIGQLQSNSNRRLYWNQDNVGVDVPLLLAADPTNDLEATTKQYVDNAIASGGGGGGDFIRANGNTTITTTTNIYTGSRHWLNVQQASAESIDDGFFTLRNKDGNNVLHVRGNGEIKSKTGRMATHLDEYVTKRYVDQVSGGGGKTWPGRRFKFTGYGQSTSVALGHFSPYSTSTSADIYISVQDLDGIRINEGSPDYTPGVTMTLRLYVLSGGTWRGKGFGTFGGVGTDYRSDWIKLPGFTWKQNPVLTSGETYAIVVSSFWG